MREKLKKKKADKTLKNEQSTKELKKNWTKYLEVHKNLYEIEKGKKNLKNFQQKSNEL